ncbi:MAG: class I SAM-dependent methyltransferase [Coriobacteriales bacterium]|jgi:SAM-dependent methyltransferase|nr:class I SAM-dependent methyltransferase [Coriobacteriales bacterium]
MDAQTAEKLIRLNNDFYQQHGSSFAATRLSPWAGWRQCLDYLMTADDFSSQAFSVLDLACGNLRFARFLFEALPESQIAYYAVDNNPSAVPEMSSVNYQDLDILKVLLDNQPLSSQLEAPLCDLSLAFGFLHHIPSWQMRLTLLESLVQQTRCSGYVLVSFWQFMSNPQLAAKTQDTHQQALVELGPLVLDENDYLLGWQNTPGAYRYCHNFTDDELDQLIDSLTGQARLVKRFSADGRTGDLNCYLVLQVL